MTTRNGALLAATAAVLFSSTSALDAVAAEAKIKCDGGNACKGKSECHTATNACAGQNSCKGKGYVSLTQDECAAAQNANREAEQGAKKP
jgi:hypothetical protein